ncbi:alpha/beta hydrolase family protein [Nocardia mangyaensis]|uniref:alpha/beta hydrolase family protein n=1 Tax=Nocardia mangyaensis TaxID=2213200 RepID=UPI0026769CE3|nr:prolyl oligopeptidase family serine peptidase [Nocardia mangyaensis]MDO3649128.1 alpha/beta fold hydrolase [Nocardia mangyaensis]
MTRVGGIVAICAVLIATLLAAGPVGHTQPVCTAGVALTPVTITVDGEPATGRVYEPYRCVPGDIPARQLVVAVHGHGGSSADFAPYMSSIAAAGDSPVLLMDLRSADGQWRTGEWNLWAGWRDVVAATQWYRELHRSVEKTVLWGWSQGGITSGLAVAHGPPGLFDYWVDNYGPADGFTMWAAAGTVNPALPRQIERDAGGCTPIVCPLAYIERSPALLADRLSMRRAFLIHGTADTVVPFATSVELRAALTAAGKPFSFYTVVSGRDLAGQIVPGNHDVGPALFEGGCVVLRLLAGTEPLDPPISDYLVDVANDVVTAPPPPADAKCAA